MNEKIRELIKQKKSDLIIFNKNSISMRDNVACHAYWIGVSQECEQTIIELEDLIENTKE